MRSPPYSVALWPADTEPRLAAIMPLRAQKLLLNTPAYWEPVVEKKASPSPEADPSNVTAQIVWKLVPNGNS